VIDGPGLLPVFGLVVGLLIGLTGMGGGVLMTPLLMLGIGLPASAAVATDLAYSAPTKIAGAWQHWRQGTVDRRVVRYLALGSVPSTLFAVACLGVLQARNIDASEQYMEKLIGLILGIAAVVMLLRIVQTLRHQDDVVAQDSAPRPFRRNRLIAIGVMGGFLVGLTSIGSGSLIIALLVLVVSLEPKQLVGTDVVHAAALVTTAALAHLFLGQADLGIAAWLLTGSIPGVLIGSRLSVYAPRMMLQSVLAILLLSTAVKLL
jgi:uncharacterized protein